MSEPRPTLQFDLDLEAVRLLHRSVSFHLEARGARSQRAGGPAVDEDLAHGSVA